MKNKIFHTQDPCLHTNSRCAKNSSRMEIIMELLEIAKKRHSVRKYTGKEIEQEKLDKILEAAHVAPTAANMQPVRLIVVKIFPNCLTLFIVWSNPAVEEQAAAA